MAKLWYMQTNQDAAKLAKVVKTNNYLNRMLLEPGANIVLDKKKAGIKETGSQCSIVNNEPVVVREIVSKMS